jgi:hypothetical protein
MITSPAENDTFSARSASASSWGPARWGKTFASESSSLVSVGFPGDQVAGQSAPVRTRRVQTFRFGRKQLLYMESSASKRDTARAI